MLGTALQGYNLAFQPELNAAVEYQKQCHDEGEKAEGNRRPHFPGVADRRFCIRPLTDTPADLALLAGWLGGTVDLETLRRTYLVDLPTPEIPCVAEADGQPLGYLQFSHPVGSADRTFRVGPLIGVPEGERRPLLDLMLTYLFEMEGAGRVLVDGTAFDAASTPRVPFRLVLPQQTNRPGRP